MDYIEPTLFYTTQLDDPIPVEEYKREFTWEHEGDCCEEVYVDLEHEPTYLKQIEWNKFDKLEYRTCPWDWFIVKLYCYNSYIWHIYYPCYNIQNWYYSDNLTLKIKWSDYQLDKMNCIHDILI